jgi:helicase
MRYELPDGHGLSAEICGSLVFTEEGKPSLTDAQYDALEQGIGRGDSVLVVSPTSTGKTQIALWAIARGIQQGFNTVYLVTHRALAKQKLAEFRSKLLPTYLGNDPSSLVIATGDYVEDCDGVAPASPLEAPLLVATYEKYLALLSAAGVPTDMTRTVVVCDEIQLIGDEQRGQNVEVLLTLLRNAGWQQFVGLSAVLDPKDASELANWLGIKLVSKTSREKHLRYECWTPQGIASATTAQPDRLDEGQALPNGIRLDVASILGHLLSLKDSPRPIIVFCMRKQDTFELAGALVQELEKRNQPQLSLAFDDLPETSANAFLSRAVAQRIGIHTADLTEDEREIVEFQLGNGELDVVFATSTLAAGVNFPLGLVMFAGWKRYDFDLRQRVPISQAEFHNMAGRAGRMGFEHTQGQIILIADNHQDIRLARGYLNLGHQTKLNPRVDPSRFGKLALQLVSSNICATVKQVQDLVCATFSALRQQDNNLESFKQWPQAIAQSIDGLIHDRLLLKSNAGRLTATPVGRAVGHSGLLPETGIFLLNYAQSKADVLSSLLPTQAGGDLPTFAFLVFAACLSSPEFRGGEYVEKTRFLPYPLDDRELFNADRYAQHLPDPTWRADVAPINSAKLAVDWIEGQSLKELEEGVPNLSAGMLRDLFRNLLWTLQGFAAILEAEAANPNASSDPAKAPMLKKLPRVIRRLEHRLWEGLPDDALWMTDLVDENRQYKLGRHEILALRSIGLDRPEALSLGTAEADALRAQVFAKAKPTPQAKSNRVRDMARSWKVNQRKSALERHKKRAAKCQHIALIDRFYTTKGKEFEAAFEDVLNVLSLPFQVLDDGQKTGAPDYLLQIQDCPPLVVELKSKEGDKLVDYNKAVEVLSAAEIHGYKDAFCVTLCHPGVDPSVPLVIAACGRLSVVESCDLGEALLRTCQEHLTSTQLWEWLATPGQALASDLPWKEYPSQTQ